MHAFQELDDPPPSVSARVPSAVSVTVLRAALEPFRRKRDAYALLLLSVDLCLLGLGQWLAVACNGFWPMSAGVLVTWVAIVRLFVIGHDACHQALTSSARLNRWIGRIAFSVSFTPFSLWRVGHNIVHHGFNNLRERDFIWEPITPEAYLAMSRSRRWLERVYRGALGPGVYYVVEIWWKRLFFPNRRLMPTRRPEFLWDCVLGVVVGLGWVGAVLAYWHLHALPLLPGLFAACLVPLFLWNWTMGLIVYLHHTHPHVRWYRDRRDWQSGGPQLAATVHLIMPAFFDGLMHHIMQHPAHHLDSTVPLYHLAAAQRHLSLLGATYLRTPFTLSHCLRCVRICKLYDYARQCWMPFPGGRVATASR